MPRRSSPLGALSDRFGTATAATAVLLVAMSIVAVFCAAWLHDSRLADLLLFDPVRVTHGQVWRLITYPWIEGGLLGLFFSVWALLIFMSSLERVWGTRTMLVRMAVMIVVPAAVVALLGVVHEPLQEVTMLGPTALISAMVVAFASELPSAPIGLFFLPIQFNGDALIWLEAGILTLGVLFSGTILGFAVQILSFLLALAWFRFNLARGTRRFWLRMRKRQIESRMSKLRKQRNLRIVPDDEDDDDQPGRLLH
jgi:membrane associated rhomboid family serine protease